MLCKTLSRPCTAHRRARAAVAPQQHQAPAPHLQLLAPTPSGQHSKTCLRSRARLSRRTWHYRPQLRGWAAHHPWARLQRPPLLLPRQGTRSWGSTPAQHLAMLQAWGTRSPMVRPLQEAPRHPATRACHHRWSWGLSRAPLHLSRTCSLRKRPRQVLSPVQWWHQTTPLLLWHPCHLVGTPCSCPWPPWPSPPTRLQQLLPPAEVVPSPLPLHPRPPQPLACHHPPSRPLGPHQ
mmetsp:Transcript_32751/g.72345  ORF Transcript_32751/g.72345 Transcript_32751/m.72345 type:complete len:235 (-) Transcript_32751:568-1272(-)